MHASDLTLQTAHERESALARRRLRSRFLIVLAVLATSAVTAAAGRSATTLLALEPDNLTRARVIRSELTAHYRLLPGRKLVITEATTTGVVSTLTLVTDWLEPRVVAADNGIYYAVCSARARCPYPARSAAWRAAAYLPRRLAVQLALRTFAETSVALVVVALPTAEPVWVVFERTDLLADSETSLLLDLCDGQAVDSWLPPEVVGRLTDSRLFRPLPILPPPPDTIYAVPLLDP